MTDLPAPAEVLAAAAARIADAYRALGDARDQLRSDTSGPWSDSVRHRLARQARQGDVMTLKLRPRLHWHNSFKCWCNPPELTEQERLLLTTGLAGFCEHGVGMLDDCPECCPPALGRVKAQEGQ